MTAPQNMKRKKKRVKAARLIKTVSDVEIPFYSETWFRRAAFALVFIVLVLSALFFLRGGEPPFTGNPVVNGTGGEPFYYEITEEDILLNKSIRSETITVLGVKLGDTRTQVIDILSEPDNFTVFKDGEIANFYYKQRIGCNHTCVLVHFDGNIATRISMFDDFSDRLVGDTQMIHDKSWVYFNMGIPDTFIDIEPMRRFIYSDRGIEVYLRRKLQMGMSLFPSDPSKARNVTKVNITEEDILAEPTTHGNKVGDIDLEDVFKAVEGPTFEIH